MSQRYARPLSWAATRCVPPGVKIGTAVDCGTPGSGAPIAWPLSTSQTLTVPSEFPVASVAPSGLKATCAATRPVNHGVTGFQVAVAKT